MRSRVQRRGASAWTVGLGERIAVVMDQLARRLGEVLIFGAAVGAGFVVADWVDTASDAKPEAGVLWPVVVILLGFAVIGALLSARTETRNASTRPVSRDRQDRRRRDTKDRQDGVQSAKDDRRTGLQDESQQPEDA